MRKSKILPFKRKREGKTDYKKRINLLSSNKPRLVVRKFINSILAQLIIFENNCDKVLLSAHTNELKKYGWKANTSNLPSAYLLGYLIGKKAHENNIKQAILDIGLSPSVKGSISYAVVKGAIDSNLNIPYNPDILPSDDRLQGKHIQEYASKKPNLNFTKYQIDPKNLSNHVNEIKEKIKNAKAPKRETS